PAAGDVLQYNSTTFDWEPKPVSALPSIQSIQNIGTGQGQVWSNTTAGIASLKSLKQGTDITITENSSEITINATVPSITNIYNADGTITDPVRTLNGNGGDLLFNNIDILETNGANTHINGTTEVIVTT